MATYSDHEQRRLDLASGEDMDRRAERRKAREAACDIAPVYPFPLTDAQKTALRAVFDRGPIVAEGASVPLTFGGFVKSIQPMFGGDGAIVVRWLGMWLAIEPDGYTHS